MKWTLAITSAVAVVVATTAARAEPDGKALFAGGAQPACSICHTLADAGAAGAVGPSLDSLKPDEAKVRAAVTSGVGIMPAYADLLSADEIDAIAGYVAEAAQRGACGRRC